MFSESNSTEETAPDNEGTESDMTAAITPPPKNFVLISGGTFEMGSPGTENWRSEDETQHSVTVSDFYMSQYELPQAEYAEVMAAIPAAFREILSQ